MHGKKRAEYKARLKEPKAATVLAQKAQQWHALMKELQTRRCDNDDNKATATVTLSLLEKALLVNPDPLHLWNHRRQVLLQQEEMQQKPNGSNTSPSSSPTADPLLASELPLTQAALQRNPKAYGAWSHRKWVLQHVRPPSTVLQQELELTTQFLTLDERNFHCWNFRRFVVGCIAAAAAVSSSFSTVEEEHNGVTIDAWTGAWTVASGFRLMGPQVAPPTSSPSPTKEVAATSNNTVAMPLDLIQSEFDFTTSKIKDNFSNFSAFHYRSQLLPVLMAAQTEGDNDDARSDLLDEEFRLLEDAFCTEPDDQTAWWYHSILLDKLVGADKDIKNNSNVPTARSWMTQECLKTRLEEQAELLRELWEESPGKWVILGLSRVLQVLLEDLQNDVASEAGATLLEERQGLLQRLLEIDPDRAERYEAMLQQ